MKIYMSLLLHLQNIYHNIEEQKSLKLIMHISLRSQMPVAVSKKNGGVQAEHREIKAAPSRGVPVQDVQLSAGQTGKKIEGNIVTLAWQRHGVIESLIR